MGLVEDLNKMNSDDTLRKKLVESLETAEIERLEAIRTIEMTDTEYWIHRQKIADCWWRRRMAMLTDEEKAAGVCAPSPGLGRRRIDKE